MLPVAIGGVPHARHRSDNVQHILYYSRSASVMGGTEQIQRNLIATRCWTCRCEQ